MRIVWPLMWRREPGRLSTDSQRLTSERDELSAENQRLTRERDGLSAENQRLSGECRRLAERNLPLPPSAKPLIDPDEDQNDGTQVSRGWLLEQIREFQAGEGATVAALRRELYCGRGLLYAAQRTIRIQANRITNLRSIRDENPRLPGVSVGKREDERGLAPPAYPARARP